MSYLIATLQYALSRKRPYNGKGEAELRSFVRRMVGGASTIDDKGNLIIDRRQRNDGATSRTLFVAHLDTVHKEDGRNTFVQDKKAGKLLASGAALGADDGAGVAMLVHMLKHGVPGLYVFTVGEERGGIGATHFAKEHAATLTADIDRAIAFDRRGGTSVITSQSCGKCASEEFAQALSDKLSNAHDALLYMPDDTGVYTDTAEFVDYVAECTNISVGYDMEHSDKESLDMRHFEALAIAVLTFDWDALPAVREPGDDGYDRNSWWGKWGNVVPTTSGHDNPCSREERMQLYDAIDMAERGQDAVLREMLAMELQQLCAPHETDALWQLMDWLPIYPDTFDAMYDAAGSNPGFELNAAAHAFADDVDLWDRIDQQIEETNALADAHDDAPDDVVH